MRLDPRLSMSPGIEQLGLRVLYLSGEPTYDAPCDAAVEVALELGVE